MLMVFTAIKAPAQFRGNCGDYRYTIDGKLISSIDMNGEGAGITVKTYYKVDDKNGYIWFWIEETEAGRNRIGKYISMWTRLSEFSNNSFNQVNNNPSALLIQLKSNQQFFFTTVYTTQKKGPQYEVRNKFLIRFKNEQDALAFANEARQYLPRFN